MVAKVFIGVDVSKMHLDIHLNPLGKALRIKNSTEGMKLLLSELSLYNDRIEQIVCESTGGYEALMLKTLKDAGYRTWLVEPKRIKAFVASEGRRSKTDKGDAQMIALFAAQKTRSYEEIEQAASGVRLNALSKRRASVTDMLVVEKLHLEHPLDPFCEKQVKKHIAYLEKLIAALEREMDILIECDSGMKRKIEVVDSFPGVGRITAASLVSGLPELGKIDGRKISALVGVAPFTRESGMYRGSATTSAGRPRVRQALFMAALTAIIHNKPLKEFYQRLVKAGKRKMVALVAVMRKMIVIINAMARDNELWKPKIQQEDATMQPQNI